MLVHYGRNIVYIFICKNFIKVSFNKSAFSFGLCTEEPSSLVKSPILLVVFNLDLAYFQKAFGLDFRFLQG